MNEKCGSGSNENRLLFLKMYRWRKQPLAPAGGEAGLNSALFSRVWWERLELVGNVRGRVSCKEKLGGGTC